MKKLVLPFAVACAFACAAATPRADESRVAEIAQWLPEKPGPCCPPPSDRAAWGPFVAKEQWRAKAAEKILAEPVPEVPEELYLEFTRTGNRTHFERAHGAKRNNLDKLFWAELIEWKGRFLPKIAEYLDSFCREKSWVMPAHDGKLDVLEGRRLYSDLGASSMALQFARVLAMLGDRLPPETVAKMRSELRRRVFEPYLATNADPDKANAIGNWWYYGESNWNAVCNANVIRAALTVIDDRVERARFAEAAERTHKFFLSGFTPDGYCSEGIEYWDYGFGHYVYLGLSLRQWTNGKLDIFADPKAKTVMRYGHESQVSLGRGLPFADGGGNPSEALLALGTEVWPDLANSATLKRPRFVCMNMDETLLRAFSPAPKATATMDVLPVHTAYPDAQVWICRDAPGAKNPLVFAFKGGHNAELHNHNDVGSYAVYVGGDELAADPGWEVYTRFTFSSRRYESKMLNSFGHPVPVVDGKLQSPGRKFAAKVVSQCFSDVKDVVVLDLSGAYEAPKVKSLTRTFTRDRAAGVATVTDKVEFSEPCAFEVPVVTRSGLIADYDPARFVLSSGKRKVAVSVAVSGGEWEWKRELFPNRTHASPKRLAVAFAKPVTEAEVSFTFKGE